MTTAPAGARTAQMSADQVPRLMWLLEHDFGEGQGSFVHHALLDCLDRGERERFVVWPAEEPVALLYLGESGTFTPAGDPEGAAALADVAEQSAWRILIGDLEICQALLDESGKTLFRRRGVSSRQQRFLTATAHSVPDGEPPEGFRRAVTADTEALTEFACRLHVEDRMGPPISRAGRAAVRARVIESLNQGATWVVACRGAVIAKIDVSPASRRWGAQLAGVYVAPHWRGRGIGTAAVRAVSRHLLDDGMPVVSLHVRADNAAALAAYRRAGFGGDRPWLLALR